MNKYELACIPLLVAIVLSVASLVSAATPMIVTGDRIEKAYAGLVPLAPSQSADLQAVCGPNAPNAVVAATLYGVRGTSPENATAQVFKLSTAQHPFAVAFYAGQSADEDPFEMVVADAKGIITAVYTGDPNGWPPLCGLF